MKTRPRLLAVLAALIWISQGAAADPVVPPISHQGRLAENNVPANGLFDFEVRFFDASTQGKSMGVVGCNLVPVANGVFALQIPVPNPPSQIFNGEPRWLELSVRRSGTADPFARLEPRQPIGAAPYSFHALTADKAHSVDWNNITSVPPSAITTYRAGAGLAEFRPIFVPPLVEFSIAPGAVDSSMLAPLSVTWDKMTSTPPEPGMFLAYDGEKLDFLRHPLQSIADSKPGDIVLYAGGTSNWDIFIEPTLSTLSTDNAAPGQVVTFDGNTVGWKDLLIPPNTVSTAHIADNAITTEKVSPGNLVKSLNGLKDDVVLSVKSPLSLHAVGNELQLEAPSLGNCNSYSLCYWSLLGNAGTTAGLNFLGTTDDTPVEFRVNNVHALRFQPSVGTPNIIGGYGGNSVGGIEGGTISGGGSASAPNHVAASAGSIGGGMGNTVAGSGGAVGGGIMNSIGLNSFRGVIAGGGENSIGDDSHSAAIAGGWRNQIASIYGFIGGGSENTVGTNAAHGVISGGFSNRLDENTEFSVIAGGKENRIGARGGFNIIAAGFRNEIGTNLTYNVIAGGMSNSIHSVVDPWSTVGEVANLLHGPAWASVGGGFRNRIVDSSSGHIGGGSFNFIRGSPSAVIGGGQYNVVYDTADHSTISGGMLNYIEQNSPQSVISGGTSNAITGFASSIPGGYQNWAWSNFSFAAGFRAWARNDNTFVWNDGAAGRFGSTAPNQLLVHAIGGVGVNVNNPEPGGISVDSDGTALELRRGNIRVTGAGVGTTGPAFIHMANAANTFGVSTRIDHPYCNGKPDAILLITYRSVASPPSPHNHPVGAFYDPDVGFWEIANQDGAPMSDKAAFNVLVINP